MGRQVEIEVRGKKLIKEKETTASIRFGSYNICNGCNGGLELALHRIVQVNMDMGVFHKTNSMGVICMQKPSGYHVLAYNAPSKHQGGVLVFYRNLSQFQVEEHQQFGPTFISFHLNSGKKRCYMVRCYISPINTRYIKQTTKEINQRPNSSKLLVAGDTNMHIDYL